MKNRKETPFLRNEEITENWRKWYIVDAKNQNLGRISTKIASVLRGKHKPQFTAHVDSGDFVIVVNAKDIALTGNKDLEKTYYWHTGYPGAIKQINVAKLLEKKPCDVVYRSVKGMMPKNALSRKSLRKLKIYESGDHPHMNQKPQPLKI
jgi:large subunit ribosomal protein L13